MAINQIAACIMFGIAIGFGFSYWLCYMWWRKEINGYHEFLKMSIEERHRKAKEEINKLQKQCGMK